MNFYFFGEGTQFSPYRDASVSLEARPMDAFRSIPDISKDYEVRA